MEYVKPCSFGSSSKIRVEAQELTLHFSFWVYPIGPCLDTQEVFVFLEFGSDRI
ncbi:hypothetical protein SETIT_6G142500v2 [Setaria italica]|uniref:Uncharacterized protein n=2 Tax=Setaria TaxID=4554 RepID=A0A368RLD3_SETIT|nr:hypothetical protein SETIT_6G142500v2 [Setaria italica]RCV31015.1 hypothetical protein SETIT_6G142500v2 [Setaria italica]TKW10217.1 hypothetical protein SEVIR_6G147500v2 [Setaria viridis]